LQIVVPEFIVGDRDAYIGRRDLLLHLFVLLQRERQLQRPLFASPLVRALERRHRRLVRRHRGIVPDRGGEGARAE
jgi:hypothetical protein